MVLKVQSKNGKVYEGEGFCIDPVTKSLLLKTTDGDYVIVNPDNVSSISGPFSSIIVPDLGEHQLSTSELRSQEEHALRQAEKSLESLNHRVSGDIQALYDRMSKLFSNCVWKDDNSFLILDEYLVEPPNYDAVRIRPGREASATAGLPRISKMLEGERKKLKLSV